MCAGVLCVPFLTLSACSGASPKVSHVIPLWVLQLLKSKRWNFAVFEVVLCLAVGELHAKLVDV